MLNAVYLNNSRVDSFPHAIARAAPYDEIQSEGGISLAEAIHTGIPLTFTGPVPLATITAHGLMRSGDI